METESTGSPRELGEKLGVSERSVYCLFEELRDYGALVQFDRKRKTYYYQDDFELQVNVSISVLSAGIITTSYHL